MKLRFRLPKSARPGATIQLSDGSSFRLPRAAKPGAIVEVHVVGRGRSNPVSKRKRSKAARSKVRRRGVAKRRIAKKSASA